jgi:magnesium-protoporphyrin O-methyltransferase
MRSHSYAARRGELEEYFDRTAAEAWKRLTSDAPVSGIRATVRAGREEMRNTLLSWLPSDLRGRRVLDAGCGTGVMAMELACRGANVVAVDISESLVGHAAENARRAGGPMPRFHVGDMLDPALGEFDHIVAMDSLIHYKAEDIVGALAGIAPRIDGSILFTVAPRTPLLTVMHNAGKLFPRADRAPRIVPLADAKLRRLAAEAVPLKPFAPATDRRVQRGFYTSHAYRWVRR